MHVYVTGAGGFVGKRLLPRLQAEGCAVTHADLEIDVTDPASIEGALKRAAPDAIIHLAALSSVTASIRDPAACFRVNYLGTLNLLRASERVCPAARILLIGSAEQYASTEPGHPPFKESDPLRPHSPYARSKAAAEKLGSLAAARGRDVVRVRSFNHTGPGQADQFVASSFARQVAEIECGVRPPAMRVGNLDSVRDFLDVDDVIDAYWRVLAPSTPADVYNVASGNGVEIREILDILVDVAGIERPDVTVDPARCRPTDSLVGNPTRLRDATGWKPTIGLRQTLEALLGGWRQQIAAS